MSLSKFERLTLSNQYRIMAALYPDEADSFNERAEALKWGYELEYDQWFEEVSEVFPESECRFVIKVLAMYDAMRRSWEELTDKGEITKANVTYQGYDGNNESRHMGYSRFVVETVGQFDYLEIGGHNSHMRMIDTYRNRLSEWQRLGEPYDMDQATLAGLLQIRASLGPRT